MMTEEPERKEQYFRKFLTTPDEADSYVSLSLGFWSLGSRSDVTIDFKLADCTRSVNIDLSPTPNGRGKLKILREALDLAEAWMDEYEGEKGHD